MKKLIIRPAAEADVDAAADYYVSEANLELALLFYDAVDETLGMLLEQPHLGVVQEWLVGRLAGCRRWSLGKPFAVHQVFYLPSEAAIEVVRVLHGARDLPKHFADSEQ